MADIRLDLDRLATVHDRLVVLADELGATEQFNHAVGAATGHGALSAVVGEFASWWNIRRENLIDELHFVAESAQAIRDTFIELDNHLAETAAAVIIEADG